MGNDYLKREPSKTEKMIYELVMAQNSMEKGLWSTSSLVMVLAILTKQDPKAIAELMVNGDEKLREFSGKINEEIKKLEEEKHKGHDHAKEEKPAEEAKA
ncbi:MAG: hypothetical protein HY918_05475 [Candidatus Doudnabacteria bacterium]|nr:hypothetical protein [Candidatus Doudnabacteria bacterium]